MLFKLITFDAISDERGVLVSLESKKNIPFEIKRVYYMYNIPTNQQRGKHAHKELEQVIVCLSGSCKFILDDGRAKKEIKLNEPNVGLYIGKNVWREMRDFSKSCVLMVLASKYYDEKEYIRDYEKFLKSS